MPAALHNQPASVSFVKPQPKVGNVTDIELKLQAAMERIMDLEDEVALLKSQRKKDANTINDQQTTINLLKKDKNRTRALLWGVKRKWEKRKKLLEVTEKKRLAYAKEFMYKHTCWSKRMIDRFLDSNKKQTMWTKTDLQLGWSIYSLSPRAYRFLLNFNLLPLPKKSTLRKASKNGGILFKAVGTETGTLLYEQTEKEQQQAAEGVEEVIDIDSDDEDEETEQRMNEEMAEADQANSSDSEEENEGDDDDDVKMLDSSSSADKSTLEKSETRQDSVADQDFLASLMEEVVLPENGRSMPNL